MYYLRSRYYDPEVCRFINADSFASTDQGIIGYNMFAYCNNNPVKRADPSGKLSLGPAVCFLLEWIFGNGGMVVFSDGSSIVEQLRASKKMNTYVKKAIDNYINGQPITAGTGEFTQKEDGYDLFLSTQHFEYAVYVSEDTFRVSVFGWEIEKTRLNATVFVHDTYNFDEYRQWNSFGNIMNNLAFTYHSIGGGNDFEWFAIYTYSTGWLSHM